MLDETAKIIQTICPIQGGKWGWSRDLVSLLKINDIYSISLIPDQKEKS
jgi:hypothetical protein